MSVSRCWTPDSTSSQSIIFPTAAKPLLNEYICGRSLVFRLADIRNEEAIFGIRRTCDVTAVIHLAGLKAVGDSNLRPLAYYENNVLGTMRLVSAKEGKGKNARQSVRHRLRGACVPPAR